MTGLHARELYAGGHLYDAARKQEHWPFSNYPMFAGLALLGGHLVLLGDRWEPAVAPLRWLAVFGMLLGLTQTAQVALKAVGRPQLVLASRATQLVGLTGLLMLTVKLFETKKWIETDGLFSTVWVALLLTAAHGILHVVFTYV